MLALSRLLPGAVLLLAPLGAVSLLDDPIASFPVLIASVAVATSGWLLALRKASRLAPGDGGLLVVLTVSLAARAALLLPEAPLSDDLYRYLWDGRVQNAGINPFLHPPASPELEPLRDELIWPRINHPEVPTIYPPVAQGLFAGLDRVAPTPLGARAAAAAADLAVVLGLALLLRARKRPPALALAHGWCPLAILETAGGGHVDALGVALLVAALFLFTGRESNAGAGVLVGMSALVKPMGVFLAPTLLGARSGRARILFLGGGLFSLVLFVPYLEAGPRLLTGFLTYAERWHFNDGFYSVAVGVGIAPAVARAGLTVVLLAAAFWVPSRTQDPLAATGCVLGAILVLSPTVHPWYALWLVPFVPFLPRAVAPGAIWLVALLPLSYFTAFSRAQTGVWSEPVWTRAVLWIPVFALLIVGALRSRMDRRGAGDGRDETAAPRGVDPPAVS